MSLCNEPVDISKRRQFDDIWTTNKDLYGVIPDLTKRLLTLEVVSNQYEFKIYINHLLGTSKESHNNSVLHKRVETPKTLNKVSGVYIFQTGPAYDYRFYPWNPITDERFESQIANLAGNPRYVIQKGHQKQHFASDLWDHVLYTDMFPAFMPYKTSSFDVNIGLDVQGNGYNNVSTSIKLSSTPTFTAALATDDKVPSISLNDKLDPDGFTYLDETRMVF